ncbi:hypothetical protein Tco_0484319 [Tanacetum coccineum]
MVISSQCLIDRQRIGLSPEQKTGPALASQSKRLLKPAVSVSFIKQFWRSVEASTDDNGEVKIIATIDGHSMTITEASLRRHLKLDDQDDKLTFQKGDFSPQWRFLIHNILHCLSPKKTAWEQFSSNIATAVIYDSSKQGRKLSDEEVQEKASTETEPFIQEVTPTEVIQDQGSNEKGSTEVSTAGATKGTASEVLVVSTAEENISTAGRTVTYSRRSEEQKTRKEKGKAIMTEPEPKKKSKKKLEQERLSFAEAIKLEEQMNEEQRAHIARDEEIARQWDKEERQRAMGRTTRLVTSRECLTMRLGQYLKRFGILINIRSYGDGCEKIEKSLPRKRRSVKRQKLEEDAEKEELKGFLDIIPREEFAEDGMAVQNYKVLSEMLEDFDRQDVEELYRLVKERYSTLDCMDMILMLCGSWHTLFEPDEEDEIWKNQHEYKCDKLEFI